MLLLQLLDHLMPLHVFCHWASRECALVVAPPKSQRNITKDDISHIPNPVPKGIKTLRRKRFVVIQVLLVYVHLRRKRFVVIRTWDLVSPYDFLPILGPHITIIQYVNLTQSLKNNPSLPNMIHKCCYFHGVPSSLLQKVIRKFDHAKSLFQGKHHRPGSLYSYLTLQLHHHSQLSFGNWNFSRMYLLFVTLAFSFVSIHLNI
ncbi:unnamed protein product [Brassica rapa]|uniref:Uncharacterized protein n=2 Tax=Brassica TaxID=3705 RepID=A0A8D9M159_BRACM|nr:unnamed protein product [Brassica napus]CAG7894491.1 unnamed protein product [Brassica rapa]